NDIAAVLKCTAQAASMMRQARGWHTALRRAQAARRERQENTASDEAATRVEQRALQLLAQASAIPAPSAQAPPTSGTAPEPKLDDPAEAEAHAARHPSKAALIRSLGRLPKKFDGEPLSPQLVHDIVNSASPILQALAKRPRHYLEAAAA